MKQEVLHYYDFGPFRLSVRDRLLMRNGEVVSLTPKLIDTLMALVENRGHVVTKNTLMEMLWPDSFVEESSLTQNISLLRKALTENGEAQQYIETIPKRGYRFIANVREGIAHDGSGSNGDLFVQERVSTQLVVEEQILHDSKEPFPKGAIPNYVDVYPVKKRKTLAVMLSAAVVLLASIVGYWLLARPSTKAPVIPNSVAVLPFKTVGVQSEPDLIGLGLADAVILRLNRMGDRTVLPTSSVYKYTRRDEDVLSIGRDLGVDAILDGTVQRDGDRVRVSAVFIRLIDRKTIWSQTFDSPYTNAFELQDAISEKVVAGLLPAIAKPVMVRMTNNPEAYQAYLTGLYFWNLRNKENLPKAISYFEQAVRSDDHFALAHALLADSYFLSYRDPYRLTTRDDALAKATASANRALDLDDSMAEAHTVRAGVAFDRSLYDEARDEFERALERNPNYALAHLRYAYFLYEGELKLDQAISEARRAAELDPVSPVTRGALGFMLLMTGDLDGAMNESQRSIELQPDKIASRLNLVEIFIQKRMFKEAELELDKVSKNEHRVLINQVRVYLYAVSGRRDEALRLFSEIKRPKGTALSPYEEAVIYAALSDKDLAFKSLQKESPTRATKANLLFDHRLDSLRSDKRFAELLNRPLV